MSTAKDREPLKIGVLASGSGSNLQAIIDAINAGLLHARIVCVISDLEDARALDRARDEAIPCRYISAEPYKTKLDGRAEEEYLQCLREHEAQVVALAGFMRIVKKGILKTFRNRILNIHPSLLPAFPGVESWTQALNYGVKITGCTVHLVDEGTDTGPIIIQKPVPVLEDDTPESLHARIQEQEHVAYPEALQMMGDGRLSVQGRRVRISPKRSD
jgi:phosphoribosylglycinamide formyltransferase-1